MGGSYSASDSEASGSTLKGLSQPREMIDGWSDTKEGGRTFWFWWEGWSQIWAQVWGVIWWTCATT